MKTEKEINKLAKKYLGMEKVISDKLLELNREFEMEKDLIKKTEILINRIVPEAVNGLLLMDKANVLNWVKAPNMTETELMWSEEIINTKENIENLNNLAINLVKKNWIILNTTLKNIQTIIASQQDIIKKLAKELENKQNKK